MTIEIEKLMESRGLPESDRDHVRDFLALLAARAEFRRTGTDEARARYRELIAKAGGTG